MSTASPLRTAGDKLYAAMAREIWILAHLLNDHLVTLDHKDEMALMETLLELQKALDDYYQAAQSAFAGKAVAFVGPGSQKTIIQYSRTKRPTWSKTGGTRYIRDKRVIVRQKYVTGTPWAPKMRKDDA